MSHNGTRITAPVQILGDLQPVLGTSLRGLGAIITQANINPFAYCKPFRSSVAAFANATARNSARVGQDGTGDGLTIPTGVSATWEYQRPRGIGSNEWFRELDFDGYEHAATAPLTITWQNEKVQYPSGGASYTGRCSFGVNLSIRAHDGVNTSVADLFSTTNLSQLYFILVITTSKGSYYARLRRGSTSAVSTADGVIADGGGGVTIDTANVYDILTGTSSATVSLIMGYIDSDGYNKSVSPRSYSMCATAGLASATKTVEAVTTTWYAGLHASATRTATASGNTAKITAINLTLTKDASAASRTAYYRVQLVKASATNIQGGGQTYTSDVLLDASSTQTVSFPRTAALPPSIFSGYTWNYRPDVPKAIGAIIYFYQSLADAQAHTNYFNASAVGNL